MPARAQNNLRRVETLWLNFEPVEQMRLGIRIWRI